ncbi:hypothetical protein ACFL5B_01305 [Candidatus Latescibacterota bacterium]
MKSLKIVCITLALFYGLKVAGAYAAETHTPNFTWRVLNGVVNPEQWIYDGEIPVAMFEYRSIEQPGEQLLFFDRVPRPPLLRNLRLTPDGPPLVEGVQLYWKCDGTITDRIVDIDVEGRGTDRLVVTFHTKDNEGVANSRQVLTLTYDNDMKTYVYDFRFFLEFNSPGSFDGRTVNFEFSDPWLVGCPGPGIEFRGMWRKRYRQFLYEKEDGRIVSIPINHFTTSHKNAITLKPDGLFAAVYEKDGNPAIQFVGDTAKKSSISICWWGYDFHLGRKVTPDELYKPILAHFRIFDCPDEKAHALAEQAKMLPLGPNEWGGIKEYPIYERSGSFAKGMSLDSSYGGDIDPFPWQFTGQGALWDRSFGRTDTYCLKIERKDNGFTRWQTFQGDGEGYYMEPWTFFTGYKVACYVKTESVTGRGSTLAVQYHLPNVAQKYPVYTARKVTGTNDWTRLEIEVGPPPPGTGCLMIMLQQDGSGTTWFDDLEVTPIE